LALRPATAASPCIGVCRLDEGSGVCVGCYRTIQEIARWGSMGRDERARVFAILDGRRAVLQLAEAGLSGVGASAAAEAAGEDA
jgi:predicted Fe-S protein YdhL (DUF1289 family)